jgi:hypothetical protein
MNLLDDIRAPSGREMVTLRPAWRVQRDDGAVVWAFVFERDGKLWISGYPSNPVQFVVRQPNTVAGALVGAGAGAAVGAALGGPPGAIVGGVSGLVFGASGSSGQ